MTGRRSGASALSMSENVDNRVEDRRQAAAFYWQEMELYAQRLLACLRTAHADGVRDEMVQLMLARKNWELQTTLVEDRRQNEARPVCGCGKPWSDGALLIGAQCVTCGQNSPMRPVERGSRPEAAALTASEAVALLWVIDGLPCMWTGRGECPHCADRRRGYLAGRAKLEGMLDG